MKLAFFGAGPFWGVEPEFARITGVLETIVGFMTLYNSKANNIAFNIETVQVRYDESIISYEELLEAFWRMHDPTVTALNNSDDSPYKSAIFYSNKLQRKAAIYSKKQIEKMGVWQNPITTTIQKVEHFTPASDFHQKYLLKQGLKRACFL